jgi:predicted nucleotidyltransferase
MDTYKLKFTILQYEILRLLVLKSGITLNQRQIASILHVSPTAVGKAIPAIAQAEYVKAERSPTMNLISVGWNRDSQDAVEYKRAENLRLIYETGLSSFLQESFPGCTIVVFGSYSRGEDTVKSDIDIAILGGQEKKVFFEKYEKILERPINVQCFASTKSIRKELLENICNGIILFGGMQL